MRTVSCLVCRSDRKAVLEQQTFKDDYLELIDAKYNQQPRALVLCSDCGFVYHEPQLDQRDTQTLYDKFRDASFRQESPDQYFDRITSLPKAQSENTAKVDWLREHLPDATRKPGRLLDIGCGGGVFIHTFLQNFSHWTAAGVEPTSAFAELAGRRLQMPVIAGSYRSGLFPNSKFDLITINQVLEHVLDPIEFLKDVSNDLADGGHVYLEVPDLLDLSYLPPEHDRFLMQHLWVFSRASLQNVCRKAGYSVVAVDQQVTIRAKRNVVVVLKKDPGAAGDLVRDDVQWVQSLRKEYRGRAAG
jgi:SAM-dependent methyltransferase